MVETNQRWKKRIASTMVVIVVFSAISLITGSKSYGLLDDGDVTLDLGWQEEGNTFEYTFTTNQSQNTFSVMTGKSSGDKIAFYWIEASGDTENVNKELFYIEERASVNHTQWFNYLYINDENLRTGEAYIQENLTTLTANRNYHQFTFGDVDYFFDLQTGVLDHAINGETKSMIELNRNYDRDFPGKDVSEDEEPSADVVMEKCDPGSTSSSVYSVYVCHKATHNPEDDCEPSWGPPYDQCRFHYSCEAEGDGPPGVWQYAEVECKMPSSLGGEQYGDCTNLIGPCTAEPPLTPEASDWYDSINAALSAWGRAGQAPEAFLPNQYTTNARGEPDLIKVDFDEEDGITFR